jgi:hypothetical protein
MDVKCDMKRLLILITLLAAMGGMAEGSDKLPGPLLDGLGDLHHPTSTRSKLAQRYFDQGLILTYAFNHAEAIRAFSSAAKVDPEFAMAYWGLANAYGPHVNKPMTREDNDKAWPALLRALDLKQNASPLERDYIDALSNRYQAQFVEDRSALDKAYANAMRELSQKYPDDLDAQVLFAEALMDTMPWDYWKSDRTPKPETEEAFAALKYALKRNPEHPGANHFYIHAVEAGPNPEWGLPSAERLQNFAPKAGHLVHMPSHIYMRVGQYHDATLSNERAVKADQSYIEQCNAQGFYPGMYYPHNLHFLWFALVYEGRSKEALNAANKVADYAMENYCGPKKALEAPRFRHLPWLTMARFGKWDEVLAVPQPAATNDFLMDRIMWHFSRGLAYVGKNDAEKAAQEHAQMVTWMQKEETKKLDNPQFPASQIFQIAEKLLAGKVAGAQGNKEAMLKNLNEAVALQDAMPYMEPAYWPFSVRSALGAAYLSIGDPGKAEAVFREDLSRQPRNGWGLIGLEESLRRQGKKEAAENVRRERELSWKYADTKLELSWF